MKMILTPAPALKPRTAAFGVSLLLAISAVCLALAPLLMPADYGWVTHTTSESAAQGVQGAWLARLGFLAFGLGVLWLAVGLSGFWARGAVWFHMVFGVCMVATAAFSHRPWADGVPFDPTEDWLHSLTATVMGFAFSFGVLVRLFQRGDDEKMGRLWDVVAVAAATFIPLIMVAQPTLGGLVQRLMFGVAYLWYGKEAWRV